MAAQIIQLDISRRQDTRSSYTGRQDQAGPLCSLKEHPSAGPHVPQFQFWTGASGDRYVHTIYPLLSCPVLPAGNFVLVHRDSHGACKPLAVGRTAHKAPSLNLAQIRHLAACLGANEVHAHLLADDTSTAKLVEYDISAQLFSTPQTSNARH